MPPLIVTLAFDAAAQAHFETLRRRHFPPERNMIPAHLTLFHKLPGEREGEIAAVLAETAGETPPLALAVMGLRFLGRGVAFDIAGPALVEMRAGLAARFAAHLTPQDRQGFRPHVTVQNKVDPAEARALFEALSEGFAPFGVEGQGLRLWRYLGGPWESLGAFPFRRVALA